jgi:hypothetical protein
MAKTILWITSLCHLVASIILHFTNSSYSHVFYYTGLSLIAIVALCESIEKRNVVVNVTDNRDANNKGE